MWVLFSEMACPVKRKGVIGSKKNMFLKIPL